jgi:hypothetical protein
MGPDTAIEYVEREPAGLACDWSVQNDDPGGSNSQS